MSNVRSLGNPAHEDRRERDSAGHQFASNGFLFPTSVAMKMRSDSTKSKPATSTTTLFIFPGLKVKRNVASDHTIFGLTSVIG
jgi:hypothetical protein